MTRRAFRLFGKLSTKLIYVHYDEDGYTNGYVIWDALSISPLHIVRYTDWTHL